MKDKFETTRPAGLITVVKNTEQIFTEIPGTRESNWITFRYPRYRVTTAKIRTVIGSDLFIKLDDGLRSCNFLDLTECELDGQWAAISYTFESDHCEVSLEQVPSEQKANWYLEDFKD